MDDLPYHEGLDYLHCIYFDNDIDVRRTNQEASDKSMSDTVMKLRENEGFNS